MQRIIKEVSAVKQPEWFVLLLPLFFVLHGYVEYYDIVYLKDAAMLFLKYLGILLLIWILFFLIFKNRRKAAVYVFLLSCFYFFFGAFHDAAKSVLSNIFISRYSFILPFAILVFVLLFVYLLRSKRSFRKLNRFLNILLLLLIGIDLIYLVPKIGWQFSGDSVSNQIRADKVHGNYPDVYFILTDEYAGSEQLKAVFNYDNKPFEDELRRRGFKVISGSKSNYNITIYSLASMLNMDYLKGIKADVGKVDIKLCFELINRSKVAKLFKSRGYEMINYSVFNFSNIPAYATTSFLPAKLSVITDQTFYKRVMRDIVPTLLVKWKINLGSDKSENSALQDLNRIEQKVKSEASRSSNKPKFVYAHLMMPHEPYFYDSKGNLADEFYTSKRLYIDAPAYLEYLKYSNQRFISLIDHIQTKTRKNAVIMFISDHGYRYYENISDRSYEFSNIHAVYIPNSNYANYYEGLSNVNSFRVLVNSVFNVSQPLLKDSTNYIWSGFRDDKYANWNQ